LDYPDRTHPDRTLNLTFHYGAICAYREAHNSEPEMSADLAANIAVLERIAARKGTGHE
jgi:hypothetical protein